MKPDLYVCAAKTGTNLWFRSTYCYYYGKAKRDLLNPVLAGSCKSPPYIRAHKTLNSDKAWLLHS